MRFLISDAELEALEGLPWCARLVYLVGLRPWMDYATGLVGTARRRVSLQQLREVLYVEPGPGRTASGSPSQGQVRRALEALARAGLVERQAEPGHLVFRLPLAAADVYPAGTDTKSARSRHGEPGTEADTPEHAQPSQSAEPTRQGSDTNPAKGEAGEPDTPPGSGVRETPPTTPRARATTDRDETPGSFQRWMAVLCNELGYSPNQAWSRKTAAMVERWVAEGVTVGDALQALELAEGKLGERPAPTYLADMAIERKRDRTAPVVPIEAGGGQGGSVRHGIVGQRWGGDV